MVAPGHLGECSGFKILKVILYVKYTKCGVSKTQAPQPPALLIYGDYEGFPRLIRPYPLGRVHISWLRGLRFSVLGFRVQG